MARFGSRIAIALGAALGVAMAVVSCNDDRLYENCDYVARRCGSVCNYWCDSWGCYPACYNQCWYDCYVVEPDPGSGGSSSGGPVADASTSDGAPPVIHDAGASDASIGEGGAAVCTPCVANDECGGGLCILPGGSGEDGGTPLGFCGTPCGSSSDCPADFSCAAIGETKQCLPRAGRCP